jgi:hypothetical protein
MASCIGVEAETTWQPQLITCACETLAHLKHGVRQGELFFAELLPPVCKALASPLYGAIRNGTVHLYDTKIIRVEGQKLEIVISWREMPHLHRTPDGAYIYVNVQDLAKELRVAMDRFELQLRNDPQSRERFAKGMLESREIHVTRDLASVSQALSALKVGPPFPSPELDLVDPSLAPDADRKGSYYRRIEDIQRALDTDALRVGALPPGVQFLAYYFGCEKLARAIVGIHKKWPASVAFSHYTRLHLREIQEAAGALGLSVAKDDLQSLFGGAGNDVADSKQPTARALRNRLIHDLGPTHMTQLAEHARSHNPKMKTFLRCAKQVLKYQEMKFKSKGPRR